MRFACSLRALAGDVGHFRGSRHWRAGRGVERQLPDNAEGGVGIGARWRGGAPRRLPSVVPLVGVAGHGSGLFRRIDRRCEPRLRRTRLPPEFLGLFFLTPPGP